MHMANALLSPAVACTMCAVSAVTVGRSVKKSKDHDLDEKKIPIMGVMGAFVFAAQMVNFTIPGTGSSGHIMGGILLAALLGTAPAYLTMSAILIIQALFFADGGIMALGANMFNMGFVTCFIAYPLIFKPLVKKGLNAKRITIASILSVVLGLQLGAFGVVLETFASGITSLPFNAFLAHMQPIHLAIGLIEGIVTAGILCFVHAANPQMLESADSGTKYAGFPIKNTIIAMVTLTIITGGVLSMFSSPYPDGLEWSVQNVSEMTALENIKYY